MKKYNFNSFLDVQEGKSKFSGGIVPLAPLSSGFDGTENFSPADGEDFASDNSRVTQAASAPTYQLQITNTAGTSPLSPGGGLPQNWVLFGFNKYFAGSANFGSDSGIVIAPTNGNFTYAQFLAQSMQQPFVTMLIKILPTDNNFATIPPVLNFNMFDMGGDTMASPVYTNAYLSDFQQFNQITLNIAKKIDANTYITGSLAAGKSVIVSIFPAVKANMSNSIGAGSSAPVRQYGQVPGVNVAPLPSAGRQVVAGTGLIPQNVPLA